ncbi:MAG: DUF6580 family putative transport protein [Candidatus Omnitrophota bacterium]|jgi:hypothetical protein
MLAILLILVGILLRFVPHTPNFTPVAAIALFSGAYLNKKYSVIIPLLLMVISDFFIGFHNLFLFVWGAFIVITFFGYFLRKQKSISRVLVTSFLSSVIFYLITNFGVWAMGWYPNTLSGLANSYILGLPFFRDFTLATIIYSCAFFGAYELIAHRVKNTKLATVLLSK